MVDTPPSYVTSYVNPDSDGICSAIGYAFLKERVNAQRYTPFFVGAMGKETAFVLKRAEHPSPQFGPRIPAGARLVLVDTHNPAQLPPGAEPRAVEEIVDHHPDGDASAFPNAVIQNETVGAAATLVTERLMKSIGKVPEGIALILGAAIASNTLDFAAPSSTSRDKDAFEWLRRHAPLDRTFIDGMFKARSDLSDTKTIDIMRSDFKRFEFGKVSVGIAQLETYDLDPVIARHDLPRAIDEMRLEHKVDHFFFSGVDIPRKRTVLVATQPGTIKILQDGLSARFAGETASFDRILLRKTDLIPGLRKVLES